MKRIILFAAVLMTVGCTSYSTEKNEDALNFFRVQHNNYEWLIRQMDDCVEQLGQPLVIHYGTAAGFAHSYQVSCSR